MNPELHWQIPATHSPCPLHSRLFVPMGQEFTETAKFEAKQFSWSIFLNNKFVWIQNCKHLTIPCSLIKTYKLFDKLFPRNHCCTGNCDWCRCLVHYIPDCSFLVDKYCLKHRHQPKIIVLVLQSTKLMNSGALSWHIYTHTKGGSVKPLLGSCCVKLTNSTWSRKNLQDTLHFLSRLRP